MTWSPSVRTSSGPAVDAPAARWPLPDHHLPPRGQPGVRGLGRLQATSPNKRSRWRSPRRLQVMAAPARHIWLVWRDRATRASAPVAAPSRPRSADHPGMGAHQWVFHRPAKYYQPMGLTRVRPGTVSRRQPREVRSSADASLARPSVSVAASVGRGPHHRPGALGIWPTSWSTVPIRAQPQRHACTHGLLGWDAGWYAAIAKFGYGPLGHQSLRFFPLIPWPAGPWAPARVSDQVALVVVANVAALLAAALLGRAGASRDGRPCTWRRGRSGCSAWPRPPTSWSWATPRVRCCVLAIGCFLAVRRTRPWWWVAAALGYAAGLTRPVGALLLVPVAIEAVRHWRAGARADRLVSVLAVVAPVAGRAPSWPGPR